MVRQANRNTSILLLALLLLMMLPFVPASAENEASYGEAYSNLQTDAQRMAYRLVEEAVAGLAPSIVFEGIVDIYYRDLADVIRAVCVDHPQYFWFLETGRYHYDKVFEGNLVTSFEPEYILDGVIINAGSQELINAMYIFNSKVNSIVSGIPVNLTSDYEVALYLHDYLVEHVSYTLEGDHPSAYAALVHGQAACYGYSKAYQCLLNAAGIRARTITGSCYDENGNMVGHAWNQVWLDGACYYVDVTWDDFEYINMHACFAVSLEKISQDHFAESEFILPECGHDQLDYYSLCAGSGIAKMHARMTAAEAAPYFRLTEFTEEGAVFACEIRFVGVDVFSWFDGISWKLKNLLGLSSGTQLYYSWMYDVYYLELVDPSYQMKEPKIHSIRLNLEDVILPGVGTQAQLLAEIKADTAWTPDLVYESSDMLIASVDSQGLVTAVSEGNAIITARSPDGSVSASCAVTVSSAPEHVHKLRLFESKAPTCKQDGHVSYYLCTGCGRRYADDTATIEYSEATDFVVPATGHVQLRWIIQLDGHMQKCECGEELPQTKEQHTDADADGKCDLCGGPMPISGQNKPILSDEKSSGRWIWIVVSVVAVFIAVTAIVVTRARCKKN